MITTSLIIFLVKYMPVCCGFIDECELFGCAVCQLTHPLIPQPWVILYSMYLDLGIRKFKEIIVKKRVLRYLFFGSIDSLQHVFNTLLINLNTKDISQMIDLLVNVQKNMYTASQGAINDQLLTTGADRC